MLGQLKLFNEIMMNEDTGMQSFSSFLSMLDRWAMPRTPIWTLYRTKIFALAQPLYWSQRGLSRPKAHPHCGMQLWTIETSSPQVLNCGRVWGRRGQLSLYWASWISTLPLKTNRLGKLRQYTSGPKRAIPLSNLLQRFNLKKTQKTQHYHGIPFWFFWVLFWVFIGFLLGLLAQLVMLL